MIVGSGGRVRMLDSTFMMAVAEGTCSQVSHLRDVSHLDVIKQQPLAKECRWKKPASNMTAIHEQSAERFEVLRRNHRRESQGLNLVQNGLRAEAIAVASCSSNLLRTLILPCDGRSLPSAHVRVCSMRCTSSR